MKAYFFQRLLAYLIDFFIITLVMWPIQWIIPTGHADEKSEELLEISEQFTKQEIDEKEYYNRTAELNYEISKDTAALSIVEIMIYLLYFVFYQGYNKGQTFGKRMMKIKVQSTEKKELTYDALLKRTLLNQTLYASILLAVLLLFLNATSYFLWNGILILSSMILLIVMVVMVMFRKDGRGLHDLIAHTEVVIVEK